MSVLNVLIFLEIWDNVLQVENVKNLRNKGFEWIFENENK